MSKPIHPFDSPEEVLNSVKYFKGLDLSKQDPKTLFPLISKTFGTIPFEGLSLKKGTSLFRARKNSQFNDEKFQNLSELSIRNDNDIKSFGRANTPGQAIFYCSIDKTTAAREVTQWQLNDLGALVKKGVSLSNYQPFTQFMTISEWKTKEDLYFFTIFGDHNKQKSVDDQTLNIYRKRFEFDPDRFIVSKKLVMDFFCSEFTKIDINGGHDYYYSAFYSSLIHRMPEKAPGNGLIYLSIADDLEGHNLAIPRSKLNKLEFISADYCYTCNSNNIDGLNDRKIIIAPDHTATLQGNQLVWRDCFGKKN